MYEENAVLHALCTRRSVRSYDSTKPVASLVQVDSTVHTWVEDGSLAMGAMLNAAYAVGLGSCWIHRARETFDSEAGKALLKQWGIPETYRGVGFCILGYAAGELPQPKPRKDDQILWIN